MKRYNRKNDIVYVLDFSGTLLKKTTVDGAVEFTGVNKKLIQESIRKNKLVYSKYIFSKTPQTVVHSTWVHNPLFNDVPPEIVSEFMVQQRGWEKTANEVSDEDSYKERERLKRWNLILEKTRQNKIKKKKEWEESKQEKKERVVKPDVEKTYSEKSLSISMVDALKQDMTDNVVNAILKDKRTKEFINLIEPFARVIFKSFLKKLNNDEVRFTSFLDKETGLLCFLDMKTENIKSFEVSGITSDNLLTIDPQQILRGDIKHILKQIIQKYGLI